MFTMHEATAAALFNLPLSEPHTVIHFSNSDDFYRLHLVTAVHCQNENPEASELAKLIEDIGSDICPEVLDTVVICGTDTQTAIDHFRSWSNDPGSVNNGFLRRLVTQCKSIQIVPSSKLPDIAAQMPFLVESGPAKACLPPILPAMISPSLFLGSQTHASNQATCDLLGVTAIANITNEVPSYFSSSQTVRVEYLRCPVDDDDSQDMSASFESSFEFIHGHIAAGRKVLVHCSRGVSRSVSVVINYLLQSKAFSSFDEALMHVQQCRKGARPNRGFTLQLLERFPRAGPS